MSGMGPNLAVNPKANKSKNKTIESTAFSIAYPNKNERDASKALGIRAANPNDVKKVDSYVDAFFASKNDPLYTNAAAKLGITDYNSVNDYAKVLDYMSGKVSMPAAAAAPATSMADTTPTAPAATDQGIIDMTPGTNSNVNGNALGIRSKRSKAREASLVGMGTNRMTIPRSSGATSLNIG